MSTNTQEALHALSDNERLKAYQFLLDGCKHVWGRERLGTDPKGKPIWGKLIMKKDKVLEMLSVLIPLTKNDPVFLAHFLSYIIKYFREEKDLQVMVTYANALNDADGMPFSPGSSYKKPDLRIISAAALQRLDPILASRVLELASFKFFVTDFLREGRHFPNSLRTAFNKYLTYRENNIEIIKGIKKSGMAKTVAKMYRALHKNPTDEVAAILRWQQKDHPITFEKPAFDFSKLSDLEIAIKIRDEKLPVLGVLGALPRKMSPVIAVAILEQCSGNQAVILTKTWEDAGVLKDSEVMKLYQEKIATAKTALDRAEKLSKDVSETTKRVMKEARSEKRKEQVGDIGKIFLALDFSGSMDEILDFAKDKGVIFAECVKNPTENFRWGYFEGTGYYLPLPREFVKDAFAQVLFGKRGGGSTNCFALYPVMRQWGSEIDVYASDEQNTDGNLSRKIQEYHNENPNTPKPKACVVVHFDNAYSKGFKDIGNAYEENGIPISRIKPETLTESSLVSSAVRNAILGPVEIINQIMSEPLISLPTWYYTI